MTFHSIIVDVADRLKSQPIHLSVYTALILLVLYLISNEVVRKQARVPQMGGPRGLPLIGNLYDIFRVNAVAKYLQWSKTYGDVYQIQLGNLPIVVVNSAAAATTLFTNTQTLISRPQTYTFHKVMSSTAGAGLTIGSSPYNDSLKRLRKGAGVALNRPAIQSYVPYLDIESKDFIQDLFQHGVAGAINPLPMVQRLSLSLVMTVNWGVRVPSHEDALFREIVETEEGLINLRSITENMKDYIPCLRLINTTSNAARKMRDRRNGYLTKLNQDLAEAVRRGDHGPCIQASAIRKDATISEEELASISLSVLSGGFQTVSNTIQWSIGFLARHPDIQDTAFSAIREFYSGNKSFNPLCDAEDNQKCDYILGMAKEALRYFTVVPLALPRSSMKEVIHNGMVIPPGTTFYMNAWACNHDRAVWSDPDVFRPERWLEKPNAPLFTFGLGYRMCPAHMLVIRSLYLAFMRLLASFRLETPHLDGNTLETDMPQCEDPIKDLKSSNDLVTAPRPYKVRCIPRDQERLRKALDEWRQV